MYFFRTNSPHSRKFEEFRGEYESSFSSLAPAVKEQTNPEATTMQTIGKAASQDPPGPYRIDPIAVVTCQTD